MITLQFTLKELQMLAGTMYIMLQMDDGSSPEDVEAAKSAFEKIVNAMKSEKKDETNDLS